MTGPPEPRPPAPPAPVGATVGPPASGPAPEVTAPPAAAAPQPAPAATAAATTAAPPAALAPAAAVPPAPLGPAPTTAPVHSGPPPPAPGWRLRRRRGLARLSVGRQLARPAALELLQVTSGSVGFLVGRDQAGGPVTVHMFRRAPAHVVLVGGGWAAKLVTYRALRFGARLVVVTPDATGWIDLGRRATGRTDRVSVVDDLRSPVSRVGSADAPVLRLTGLAPTAAQDLPVDALPQWNTRLSVLPQVTPDQLTPYRAAQLAAADLLLVQRLTPPEAAALARALRLTERTAYVLQLLHDDMLAVLTSTGVRYAWLGPTDAEQAALGQPTRH